MSPSKKEISNMLMEKKHNTCNSLMNSKFVDNMNNYIIEGDKLIKKHENAYKNKILKSQKM